MNGGQITATTTLTMNLGCVDAKSVIKTSQVPIRKVSSSSKHYI